NGSSVPSGETSESLSLAVGENPITIEVTAQNGDTKTYTLTVNRAPSSNADLSDLEMSEGTLVPDFDPATTSYTLSVENVVEHLTIMPKVEDGTATFSVDGTPVTSGSKSHNILLNAGYNEVNVEVTAEDQSTRTYTISILRLQTEVQAQLVQDGHQVNISDNDIKQLGDSGTIVIELSSDMADVTQVALTQAQMIKLISLNAKVNIIKDDLEMTIPMVNFSGEALTIQFQALDENSSSLSHFDKFASTGYSFFIQNGEEYIRVFDEEIELSFHIDYEEDENLDELQVYYFNTETEEWELVGGTYKNNFIHASTNHFSTFVVFHPSDIENQNEDTNQESQDEVESTNGIEEGTSLPETASMTYNIFVFGLLLLILGAVMMFMNRKKINK
ncbi:cadherin-like beta sandwich domain-containing protein, partial [Evansella sp. AB-rgal1]|uniref:cadherin-like beta sandwich domain-containing protein n=1 Tax=Evansella sp. AB-rgal1 TaxID=3242696 RepID=UPI00359DD321